MRIGVARDAAFGFHYPDDLQALEAAGAQLVFFDTLRDRCLPAVDGVFIGGGFPECFMDELEANATLRESLRMAIERGLPLYAECGGLMYLSRRLHWKGRSAQMVGAVPGETHMHERPVGRGYVRLQETSAHPWGRRAQGAGAGAGRHPTEPGAQAHAGADGEGGAEVRAHEFHHSSLENLDPGVQFAYRVLRGHGVDGRHDGVRVHNVLASYAHLRHVGGNRWPERFVDFVRAHRQARQVAERAAQPVTDALGVA